MAAGGAPFCDGLQLGGALLPLAQLKSLYPSALSKKGSEGQADWQLSTVSTYIYIYCIYIYIIPWANVDAPSPVAWAVFAHANDLSILTLLYFCMPSSAFHTDVNKFADSSSQTCC